MSDFYGIRRGTIPGFTEAGDGTFMSVTDLPGHTVRNMAMFMDKLRRMHEDDPLAFEVCLRHVASIIEDQRREEGRTDPRENPARKIQFLPGRSCGPGPRPQRARQRSPIALSTPVAMRATIEFFEHLDH